MAAQSKGQALVLLIPLVAMAFAGCTLEEGTPAPETRPATGSPDRPLRVEELHTQRGFSAVLIADGLDFPVAIDWDADGVGYVATSGFAYGEETFLTPRVYRIEPEGGLTVVAEDFAPPLIDITWHDGRLYVMERGSVTVLDPQDGWSRQSVLTELPAWGDHHNNELTFGPDGRMYFPIGLATNSGVVGIDNSRPGFGWVVGIDAFSDIPCEDVVLAGVNHVTLDPRAMEDIPISEDPIEVVVYESPDDFQPMEAEQAVTGAYVPFGTPTFRGQVIAGQVPCTGAILVAEADGSGLDWYAWGFRNPYGLKFDADGRLWVADNGADVRGSRPLWTSRERFWQVEEKAWYGYPDFDAGHPVDGPQFMPADELPLQQVLLEHPGPARFPAFNISQHAAVTKFDFSPGGAWGDERMVYIALYGDHVPATGPDGEHAGHAVVRFHLDHLDAWETEDVLRGAATFDRRFRPVEAAFGPDGFLYVVNVGTVPVVGEPFGPDAAPRPGTGAVYMLYPTPAHTLGGTMDGLHAAMLVLVLATLVGRQCAQNLPPRTSRRRDG